MGHGEEVAQQLKPGFVATIDYLPDDLLVHILSFLPTKPAASTSVLSKRWRTLFAFTHNLDLDDPIVMGNVWDKLNYRSFRDFVYRILALQGGNHIKKLSLRVNYNYGVGGGVVVLKHWIYYALKHRISELNLCINRIDTETPFFSRVFTSTTLVKLSLGKEFNMYSFPSDISLPALKVLILDSIWIKGNQLSDVFLDACPALEDLTILHKYYRVESYVISSKTLKRLSFTCKGYFNYNNYVTLLNTPNVVDLYFSNSASKQQYLHCNLESLAKATLNLKSYNNDVDVTNLISGICNVKTLHLTFSAVEVISVCCKGGLPLFNNLGDLVFSSKKKEWKVVLPLLLERSPNLKTLVLLGLYRYTFNNRRFVGIHIPPKNQIKMLSIMEYQGGEDELKHISHFFLNMECLEVVKVYVAPTMDDPKKMQLKEDMMKLPTTSSKLKIQVM